MGEGSSGTARTKVREGRVGSRKSEMGEGSSGTAGKKVHEGRVGHESMDRPKTEEETST
ncbi:hypothetical protein KI387_017776, partial [Taxus chinensis]